jgi:Zn-finger protein
MSETQKFMFFAHRECEFFPCHKGIDIEDFNCLFCYCPLFALGKDCGGNFSYTETGIKNCKECAVPHRKENYTLITEGCKKLIERCKNTVR